jgi:hypothetical protein
MIEPIGGKRRRRGGGGAIVLLVLGALLLLGVIALAVRTPPYKPQPVAQEIDRNALAQ